MCLHIKFCMRILAGGSISTKLIHQFLIKILLLRLFPSRTFRHLTCSPIYRFFLKVGWGNNDSQYISCQTLNLLGVVQILDKIALPSLIKQRCDRSFIQPQSSAQGEFCDFVKSTTNIAFRRNCFI